MNRQSAVEFSGNRRIHIGIAVSDLEASKRFYEVLLGAPPVKQRPGYAKFETADPSVNLSLSRVSGAEPPRRPENHFGVQVKSSEAVAQAIDRFRQAGLETAVEENTTCCYAVQDKVWVVDPDGNRWEVYVVLEADAPRPTSDNQTCCDDTCCQ